MRFDANVYPLRWLATILCGVTLLSGCTTQPETSAVPASKEFLVKSAALHHARVRHANATTCSAQPSLQNCISNIVIIVQENRSFNNLFMGFPGAESVTAGKELINGKAVSIPIRRATYADENIQAVEPSSSSQGISDIDHSWGSAISDWDSGAMDHFNHGGWDTYPYEAVVNDDNVIKTYWGLAQTYALADHMYPTEFGPSFTGHLNLVAANSELATHNYKAEVDTPGSFPWGCDAPTATITSLINTNRDISNGPYPCFTSSDINTLATTLDSAGVSWKYYAPAIGTNGGDVWSIFDAISSVRKGPDWASNVLSPPKRVLKDAKNFDPTAANPTFAQVTWIIPTAPDSDHAGTCFSKYSYYSNCGKPCSIIQPSGFYKCTSDRGPSWVKHVVSEIGNNTALWKHTAIFIVWDDWGGWYDEVSPPQPDFRGLGIRVPLIVVSPYVKRGHISHTRYEFGSIVKFIEKTFGLPKLGSDAQGYTDQTHNGSTVNSVEDMFDFSQAPAAFVDVDTDYPESDFLNEGGYYLSLAPDNE